MQVDGRRWEVARRVAKAFELGEGFRAGAFGLQCVEDAVVEAVGELDFVERLGEIGVFVVIIDSSLDELDEFRDRGVVLCCKGATIRQ